MADPTPAEVAWVDQMKAHVRTEAEILIQFYKTLREGDLAEGYAFDLTRDRLEYMHSNEDR